MRIELEGARLSLIGEANRVSGAVLDALVANGAAAAGQGSALPPQLLVSSFPLLPDADADFGLLLAETQAIGEAMRAQGRGRILFLLSATAGLPMRRHPAYSARMASAVAVMRSMAMGLGPAVLVNALGVGLVGEPAVAGDPAMTSHAPLGRPGRVQEVVDAALFLCDPLNSYTSGQMLSVDGGWSAGYGRSF